ncbi:hypothetical protein HPB51_004802 [Rhipicephalus microplus]|uniref:Uncharacterized protein n=1 Tax=Rhipicephalus microplus TaxID=6941 RepID=A0A9J6E6V2_RHIMP|nr:hypothetical protein HPB51_004802 [Rhipicephalus microplus]
MPGRGKSPFSRHIEVDVAHPGPSLVPESLTTDKDTRGVSSQQAMGDEPESVHATLGNETGDSTCSERRGWTEDAWRTVVSRRAVIDAYQRSFNGNDFLLRVHPGSNIVILSTPSMEVASRLRGISQLKIRVPVYALNAYVADPEGVLREIVHRMNTSRDFARWTNEETTRSDSRGEDEGSKNLGLAGTVSVKVKFTILIEIPVKVAIEISFKE